MLGFVLRENGGGETVSKAALLHFLQHEYEVRARVHTTALWRWLRAVDLNETMPAA